MLFLLPVSFLFVQLAVLVLLPAIAGPASYAAMVAAPLFTAVVLAWRGRRESGPARIGWWALATALAIWSAGAFGNLWQELVLGRSNEMYAGSTLAFNLSAVPITFLLASEWRPAGRTLARAIDALLALALGVAYFLLTRAMLSQPGLPGSPAVSTMVWLEDALNIFICCGALARWVAADDSSERDLFRALAGYAPVYLALVAYNNHFLAGDPGSTVQQASIVTVAFALLWALALSGPPRAPVRRPRASLTRAVRVASPVLLAGALLIVSLFLIRANFAFGAAGVLIAAFGFGLRNAATQVRHIEHGETLQRERSEYQTIAWTDAVTGVPNRHFLDRALVGIWRGERRANQPLGVLMIDIDQFKRFNDRYGHPAGDACLREVAAALQQALGRPGDVLARYGGEEFIALLRDADAGGAQIVAERLRAAVEALKLPNPDSPAGVVTVSIGAASAPLKDANSASDVLAAADRALYEAKCAGRNRIRSVAPLA
ncbi:MAG: GGDEF domain-containing protein [Burkholderiales bacterium]